jgi:hypothetical protein
VPVNLDRILMTPEWGQHFPLCKVSILMRIGSDHAPILVDTGEEEIMRGPHFHFEKQWFLVPTFKVDVIGNMAETVLSQRFENTMDLWHVMMANLRRFLKGYGANLSGD